MGSVIDYTDRQTFRTGDLVELSPACDLWMRGAKYGTVRKYDAAAGAYVIKMDHYQVRRLQRVRAEYLRLVGSGRGTK